MAPIDQCAFKYGVNALKRKRKDDAHVKSPFYMDLGIQALVEWKRLKPQE